MSESILAVTMNPSVDISYPLDTLKINKVNRVTEVTKTAGGKGLNVTRVLHQLKTPVIASGILGGTIGQFIENKLDETKIKHAFMPINQESRNCIAILHDDMQQTEILEKGPVLTQRDEDKFLIHFENSLADVSVVTISGSLPKGLSDNLYEKMIAIASTKEIPVILDSSGEPLRVSLVGKHKPFLIKPNQEEIAQLIEQPINDLAELQEILSQYSIFEGVEWVVVSLGADGALIKHNNDFFRLTLPKITVVNPVGSGDSTVAGLASAIASGSNAFEIMKTGMTTGMLNTMEKQTGFINKALFNEYYNQVEIIKLN
ncbi:MAG: tagatose-6-phosphate kinase [Alkalibacterium gilvum]|uniref:tagatose-6-phosphate kinase n=1 Tax=Alkalibacterium TaxID=99906 RepID=UPI000EE0EEF9|nr:tagatose-6-phosphate kinase [Alkalibacterium sp.]MDN6293197.1 tagatose-6-phosphate kinase [Alkalibacterium sp.]MDN6294838.1 tagatose-6-phosphate kinase [Alkalibacterium sp.]MDN6728833.1 tagatose-6-phosphate kinase [Alkalibacterium sp.]HAJ69966.1 tagatose-6-phosphate kinase [Alkalibacterium sp.]